MNKNLIIAVFCSSLLLPTFAHAQDDIYYSEKDEKAEEEAYAKQQAEEAAMQRYEASKYANDTDSLIAYDDSDYIYTRRLNKYHDADMPVYESTNGNSNNQGTTNVYIMGANPYYCYYSPGWHYSWSWGLTWGDPWYNTYYSCYDPWYDPWYRPRYYGHYHDPYYYNDPYYYGRPGWDGPRGNFRPYYNNHIGTKERAQGGYPVGPRVYRNTDNDGVRSAGASYRSGNAGGSRIYNNGNSVNNGGSRVGGRVYRNSGDAGSSNESTVRSSNGGSRSYTGGSNSSSPRTYSNPGFGGGRFGGSSSSSGSYRSSGSGSSNGGGASYGGGSSNGGGRSYGGSNGGGRMGGGRFGR
jgi:hypothetical protein